MRVADEHAGKRAKCPKCGAVIPVPAAGSPPPMPAPAETPFGGPAGPPVSTNPFADLPEPSQNPYAPPTSPYPVTPRFVPHRGGQILTFGIIGILCCMPFGIAAWVMGSTDLKRIKAGEMDPAGQGLTQAGMVLGIVSVVLAALGVLLQIIMMVVAAGAGNL